MSQEWWDLYNEVSDLRDSMLEEMSSLGEQRIPAQELKLGQDYQKIVSKRKKLQGSLNDYDKIIELVKFNPTLFDMRIMQVLKVSEDPERNLSKYHPLWKLPHKSAQILMGDDIIVKIVVEKDIQKQKIGKKLQEQMEERCRQLNSVNEVQTQQQKELEKVKQEMKDAEEGKAKEENVQERSLEQRITILEKSMELVVARQEDRIQRENKELRNDTLNAIQLKRIIKETLEKENGEINQKLSMEISELKQNQQERMTREAHAPNLSEKIEKIETQLSVVKVNQLKRLAKEALGIQEKTDKEQDDIIDRHTQEIEELKDVFKKFKT